MGRLAPDLIGPVGMELDRAIEQLPESHGLPGGSRRIEVGRIPSLNLSKLPSACSRYPGLLFRAVPAEHQSPTDGADAREDEDGQRHVAGFGADLVVVQYAVGDVRECLDSGVAVSLAWAVQIVT
jgi:hypothetical protein